MSQNYGSDKNKETRGNILKIDSASLARMPGESMSMS